MITSVPTTDPITYDLTVRLNTDHEWRFRRVTEAGNPLVPSDVSAQIRSSNTDNLWLELDTTILDEGWISVSIHRDDVKSTIWTNRIDGEWDLLVLYNDKQYCWVEGKVSIDETVTGND